MDWIRVPCITPPPGSAFQRRIVFFFKSVQFVDRATDVSHLRLLEDGCALWILLAAADAVKKGKPCIYSLELSRLGSCTAGLSSIMWRRIRLLTGPSESRTDDKCFLLKQEVDGWRRRHERAEPECSPASSQTSICLPVPHISSLFFLPSIGQFLFWHVSVSDWIDLRSL